MRECWINVSVVGFRASREAVLGSMWGTRAQAVAVGEYSQYRLHVRLKVPALPDSDALAAGKAGEGSHIQQEPRHG